MGCSQMKKINIKIFMLHLTFFTFISLYFTQFAFADEILCGIGKEFKASESKETYQQQIDQITNLLNTATGALSGILGGRASQTKVPKDILEQLFSLLKTLTNFEKMQIAQGYVCIPQDIYLEMRDNLTAILSDLY